MTTKTYRAEFFTAADYAIRNFEAKTPEQAIELARRFYEDNIIDLDFRSYDDIEPLDQIEVWDQKTGKRASWQSDDCRLRKAAPELLAALRDILPRYTEFLRGVGADPAQCEDYQRANAAVAKAEPQTN